MQIEFLVCDICRPSVSFGAETEAKISPTPRGQRPRKRNRPRTRRRASETPRWSLRASGE